MVRIFRLASFYINYKITYLDFDFTMETKSDEIISQNFEFMLIGTCCEDILFHYKCQPFNQKSVNCVVQRFETLDDYLSKGAIEILVTVTIKGDPLKRRIAASTEMISSHKSMMNDPTFSDFTFNVKGKKFNVHRNILAAVSPVFLKMFTTVMQESLTHECSVENIEPNIFEHLIRFIYVEELPDNLGDLSMGLYEAAHYYGIERLKKICLKEIHPMLALENALEIFNWSFVYDLDELKAKVWKIVKR